MTVKGSEPVRALTSDYKSNAVPLSQQLQLPKPSQIFPIYAPTLLMYIVAGPDPYPRGGGQLSDPNECNSTLTSETRSRDANP